MSDVTIYHNPRCSKSRRVLELIQQAGVQPTVVEYLKTPLTAADLQALSAALPQPLAEVLRTDDNLYRELGLQQQKLETEELIALIAQHPALLNRPIVVTKLGARLCRPEERLYEILPPAPG